MIQGPTCPPLPLAILSFLCRPTVSALSCTGACAIPPPEPAAGKAATDLTCLEAAAQSRGEQGGSTRRAAAGSACEGGGSSAAGAGNAVNAVNGVDAVNAAMRCSESTAVSVSGPCSLSSAAACVLRLPGQPGFSGDGDGGCAGAAQVHLRSAAAAALVLRMQVRIDTELQNGATNPIICCSDPFLCSSSGLCLRLRLDAARESPYRLPPPPNHTLFPLSMPSQHAPSIMLYYPLVSPFQAQSAMPPPSDPHQPASTEPPIPSSDIISDISSDVDLNLVIDRFVSSSASHHTSLSPSSSDLRLLLLSMCLMDASLAPSLAQLSPASLQRWMAWLSATRRASSAEKRTAAHPVSLGGGEGGRVGGMLLHGENLRSDLYAVLCDGIGV